MYDLTSWHVLGCSTWGVFIIGSVVANIVDEGCIPCVVYTLLIVRSIWLVGISWPVCGGRAVSCINCACSVLGCLMVWVTWMEVCGSLLV